MSFASLRQCLPVFAKFRAAAASESIKQNAEVIFREISRMEELAASGALTWREGVRQLETLPGMAALGQDWGHIVHLNSVRYVCCAGLRAHRPARRPSYGTPRTRHSH